MKTYCASEKPDRKSEFSLLTSLRTLNDRSLVVIVCSGFLALTIIIWTHLTPSAHLAVVQTLQALASIGSIASIVWSMLRSNSNPALRPRPVIASAKTYKCMFLMLACGMLIGSFNQGAFDLSTLLCSIPATLVSAQQVKDCTNTVAGLEEVPTSEEYLIKQGSK